MAVERMEMMNLVGHLDDMDHVLRDMVLTECFQPVSEVQKQHIASTLEDLSLGAADSEKWVRSLSGKWEYRDAQMKLELLMERLEIPRAIDKQNFDTRYEFKDVENDVQIMFDRFAAFIKQTEVLEKELERISRLRVLEILKDVELDFRELQGMTHFAYRIGAISKEHRQKLSMNYENISAAVMHIGTWRSEEIYLVVYPKALENENLQILRSIDFEEYEVYPEYLEAPRASLAKVEERISDIQTQLTELKSEQERFRNSFEPIIRECYSKMRMEETLLTIRGMVTVTRNFFFVSGWVPKREVQKVEKLIKSYGDRLILSFGSDNQVDKIHVRPTQLNNHWFVKPFEMLVKTYGTPSYYEMDPTWFVAITYMLLFGMMFGDLGQGLVLLLAGLFIAKRFSPVAGGILSRIGISSMAFGIVYDSFFGYEYVVSKWTSAIFGEAVSRHMHFYSMENITLLLLMSVGLGMFLLILSYGISIYNRFKVGNIVEGALGKNGIAGLMLYTSIVVFAYGLAREPVIPLTGSILMIIALTCVIAFKEPLVSLIKNHRPLLHESVGMFSVEAFFETFEIYLGYLSNTLSFVRVGAFALNHIGLFMAFHIIAEMMDSPIGNVSMFLIGNMVVIGLEGMIVMIQGMRLLYYEIFSKYYTGDGQEFTAVYLEA